MSSSSIVRVDASDLRRVAEGYRVSGKLIEQVIARTINRGGDHGTVEVRSRLVQTTGIRSADTRRSKGLTKQTATADNLNYRLKAASSYTPLSYFSPTQTDEGVRARPWNRAQTFAGTFMLRMSTGYVGVFKRDRTAAREIVTTRAGKRISAQPIKELWGPSLAVELMRNDVPELFRQKAGERMATRLPVELEFALNKGFGRQRRRG